MSSNEKISYRTLASGNIGKYFMAAHIVQLRIELAAFDGTSGVRYPACSMASTESIASSKKRQ